ncbi:MAG: hypothetical protein KME52_12580 [Desmonostoc geniculatum HA4340-LM1]|jgi:hypothetical protein|nr:hypothetical protein [Desmonostoc geniculatum HA4340-LM1]
MSQSLNIQEIAIAIAAKQHNPTILTPDFLKYSGMDFVKQGAVQKSHCT